MKILFKNANQCNAFVVSQHSFHGFFYIAIVDLSEYSFNNNTVPNYNLTRQK